MKNKQSRVLRNAAAPRPVPPSRKKSKGVLKQNPDDVPLLLLKVAFTRTFKGLLSLYDSHSRCEVVRRACWDSLMKKALSPLEITELFFRAGESVKDELLQTLKNTEAEESMWYATALIIEPYTTYRDTTRGPVAEVVFQKLLIERWRARHESEADPANKIHIGQFAGIAPRKLLTGTVSDETRHA